MLALKKEILSMARALASLALAALGKALGLRASPCFASPFLRQAKANFRTASKRTISFVSPLPTLAWRQHHLSEQMLGVLLGHCSFPKSHVHFMTKEKQPPWCHLRIHSAGWQMWPSRAERAEPSRAIFPRPRGREPGRAEPATLQEPN